MHAGRQAGQLRDHGLRHLFGVHALVVARNQGPQPRKYAQSKLLAGAGTLVQCAAVTGQQRWPDDEQHRPSHSAHCGFHVALHTVVKQPRLGAGTHGTHHCQTRSAAGLCAARHRKHRVVVDRSESGAATCGLNRGA